MKYFSTQLSNENLYSIHNDITIFLAIVWIAFCFLGFYLSASNKNKITLFLIIFSVTQEIFDYINRFFLNDLYVIKMQTDLPLQLCHFAYWFSVVLLIIQLKNENSKYKQFFFNCAFFWGFSGAFQGILTVDLTGIYTFSDMLALHLQHSLIILNVLWMIFAYNMSFNSKGIMQAFIFTNILLIIIGFINYFSGSNYMFLCAAPNVKNPLLVGEWPYYLLVLEIIFIIYGYIILLPFKLFERIKHKF